MVQINLALREVSCKVVYYGPGRSGKTTNLEMVHAKAPKDSVGELVSISTETDRTLFFDFLPLNLGSVAGMTTKFALYTVPGQVYYNRTRKLVLQGADGVVFVADSSPKMIEENIESLENLIENLEENGLDVKTLPMVLQWNKRDLPDAMPPELMDEKINTGNWPTCEAVAVKGEGVFPALKLVAAQVIKRLNSEYGQGKTGGAAKATPPKQAAVVPPKPAPVAPPKPAPPQPAPPQQVAPQQPRVVPPQPAATPAAPKAAPARVAPKAPVPQPPAVRGPVSAPVAPRPPAPPSYDDDDDANNPIKRELERRRKQSEATEEKVKERSAKGGAPIRTIRSVQRGGGRGKTVMIVIAVIVAIAVIAVLALHLTKVWRVPFLPF